MFPRVHVRAVALALLAGLVLSYVLCIAGDVLFGWTMYQVWMPLLPGFTWPVTTTGFLIGLAWLIGYSLYGALVFVVPYNALVRRWSAVPGHG